MYTCEICGKEADVHHIVHRSEGGFDIDINYKYLCAFHHRGKDGPHQNIFVDLQYKIEMQTKLYNILPKKYYSPKEISQILGLHNGSLKRLLKNLKRYKEGYKKEDIIFTLMGYVKYNVDILEELALDLLIEQL
ncbi:HNH endonuclease [Clostridium celatum]|uniref:HNH endonuclease n=1 Tax=Clostridium celatum TaxID=36834 RepID=UPI00189AD88E|nr:HNH endonuclease signature motif containing protein [Clostridium celatum]